MNAGTILRIAKRPLLFARMLAFAFELRRAVGKESMGCLLALADAPQNGGAGRADAAYVKDVRYFAGVILNRGPFDDGCLMGSLLIFRFLREAGIDATINFGIETGKRRALKGAGHAWVSMRDEAQAACQGKLKRVYAYRGTHCRRAAIRSARGRRQFPTGT